MVYESVNAGLVRTKKMLKYVRTARGAAAVSYN
jgi:hypothetical protein